MSKLSNAWLLARRRSVKHCLIRFQQKSDGVFPVVTDDEWDTADDFKS